MNKDVTNITVRETETQWAGECSGCGWRTVGPSKEYVSVWCEGHIKLHAALERRAVSS